VDEGGGEQDPGERVGTHFQGWKCVRAVQPPADVGPWLEATGSRLYLTPRFRSTSGTVFP